MILTYKYRIKDKGAKRALRKHAYSVNQVWNYLCQVQKESQERRKAGRNGNWLSKYELSALTTGASSGSQSRQLSGDKVVYKGKTYRFWLGNRPVPANAKGGCFTEDSHGRWYVCFFCDVPEGTTTCITKVGIDLGLKTLATMSDGTVMPNLRLTKNYADRLAVAQRAGNKRRVRAIHKKIANVRNDQHHKATADLVKNYGFIFIGDVSSAKLAKTRMAKSVYDAGWYGFKQKLLYKARLQGVVCEVVNERFSTQTCSSCFSRSGPKGIAGLRVRQWRCIDCGTDHDRDQNAAINILHVGCGSVPPVEENQTIIDGYIDRMCHYVNLSDIHV